MTKSIRGVIIVSDHILLIKRIKDHHKYYVFPGGHTEKNEKIKQTCIREVKEETNLNVIPIKKIFELKEGKNHISIFYSCRIKGDYSVENKLPKVKLIGEEIERNKSGNYYKPVWFDIDKMDKINIYPKELINIIKKLHKNKTL